MDNHELELKIGHVFIKKNLLDRALTTNGYVNENQPSDLNSQPIQSQEAFCTLGDAVLKLILVDHFIIQLGFNKGGEITEEKKKAENKKNLAKISRKFNIGKFMNIGKGKRSDGEIFNKDDNLTETFEAIIGGIYLDIGIEASKEFIMK